MRTYARTMLNDPKSMYLNYCLYLGISLGIKTATFELLHMKFLAL